MTSESGWQAVDDDFDDPTEGVAVAPSGVDLRDHRGADLRVGATHGVGIDRCQVRTGRDARTLGCGDRPDRDDVAEYGYAADLVEEPLRHRAEGDSRCGLAGAGPLENGACVREPVLLHAHEIGMARTWPGQRCRSGDAVEDLLLDGV